MDPIGILLDRAALTLHEGFFTSSLGNRGAAAASLLLGAAFPDSLGFCFWLGLMSAAGFGGLSPAALGVTAEKFHVLTAVLVLVGVVGLQFNLRKMAQRPAVRQGAAQQG